MEVQAITKNVRDVRAEDARGRAPDSGLARAAGAGGAGGRAAQVGARFVAKTLKSAIANAENNNKARSRRPLRVKEAVAGTAMHHQAVHAQGARLGGADPQAPLPHQDRFVGRIIGMGQKTNPIGLRLAVNKDWRSKWYADKKEFGKLLAEDREIRDLLKKKLESASVPKILIERAANRCRITILTARPGRGHRPQRRGN